MEISSANTPRPRRDGDWGSDESLFIELNRPEAGRWRAVRADAGGSHPDPIAGALRCFTALESPERRRFSPSLVDALVRAPHVPFAFGRSVIEWARSRSLEHGERGSLEDVGRLLDSPSLLALGSRQASELRLLLAGYQADDLRVDGDTLGAEAAFRDLRPRYGDASPEIHAMLLELESDLASHSGCPSTAMDKLESAEALLEDVSVPGRRSSLFLRRGRLLLTLGRLAQARDSLQSAIHDLPPDSQGRERLEAGHTLAATLVADGCFK
ncbi:MAG: hypothetical protein AAFY88_11015, partial [Acidobacteriota bacterium]